MKEHIMNINYLWHKGNEFEWKEGVSRYLEKIIDLEMEEIIINFKLYKNLEVKTYKNGLINDIILL